MFLFEFNNLDLDDKYEFVWCTRDGVKLSCIRDDGDYHYALFDCGTFFAETCACNGKTIKIDGFELTDDRINLYLDWIEAHKDDPK
jgi:hypothetical protein